MTKKLLLILGLACSLGISHVSASKDPILYLPFNGDAKDASGNSNDGTLPNKGVRRTTDRFGIANSAYSLDGTANITVEGFGNKIPREAISISLWAKTSALSKSNFIFCMSNDGAQGSVTNRLSAHLRWLDGSTNLIYWDFGNIIAQIPGRIYMANPPVENEIWEHYVFISSNAGMSIYRNGVKIQSQTNHSSFTPADIDLLIGGLSSGYIYRGAIDDFMIYDRVISEQEIKELYTTIKVKAYYPFTNASAADSSNNKYNATLPTKGVSATTDRFGKANSALAFDGTSYIQTPLKQENVTQYSVSAWVKMQNGEYGSIITNRNDGDKNCGGIMLEVTNIGTVRIAANGKDYLRSMVSNIDIRDNKWHHIVGVFKCQSGTYVKSENFTIFIDGARVATNPWDIGASIYSPISGNGFIRIGEYRNVIESDNGATKGIIDDVRIYEVALSETEITKLYEAKDENAEINTNPAENGDTVTPSDSIIGDIDIDPVNPANKTSKMKILFFGLIILQLIISILLIVALFKYKLHMFLTQYACWGLGLAAAIIILHIWSSVYNAQFATNILLNIMWCAVLILGFVRLLIIKGNPAEYPD